MIISESRSTRPWSKPPQGWVKTIVDTVMFEGILIALVSLGDDCEIFVMTDPTVKVSCSL